MLCTFCLYHCVLWNISCCTQQLSPSPAVTAVTALPPCQQQVTGVARDGVLRMGDEWEGAVSQEGLCEFRTARELFCCASLPVPVSVCPFCSWWWEDDIFTHLKILLWDDFGHSLEAILYCQGQLCYLYRPIWGKQSSLLDLLSLGRTTGECHGEMQKETDVFSTTCLL